MVTEEGGEARTNNMCRPCYSELLVRLGKKPLKVAEWREIVERKRSPWQVMEIFRK